MDTKTMTANTGYPIPADTIRVLRTVKRSRFVATVGHANGKTGARDFVQAVRLAFPDADHHCWAYVAGRPADTRQVAMSDDGEPSGTAGRPMLAVLQSAGIGEIAAVVTRFFGGVKLGTGGLVRAYTGILQEALDVLPLKTFVPALSGKMILPYPHENVIRRLLETMNVTVTNVIYEDRITLHLAVPETIIGDLRIRVDNETGGRLSAGEIKIEM